MKTDVITILDPRFQECHEIIVNFLKDDLKTLYSCIRVNRSFCRIFIPVLWRNPFKFVSYDEDLIKLFNTIIHCLDPSYKKLLREGLIKLEELPTPKTYFEYHSLIKEFELNPLQRGMRLWISKNLSSQMLSRRSINRRLFKLNNYIGELFFSKGNRYNSLNIYYNELLSGLRSLFDICNFKDHSGSLLNVNKLSLGFFNENNTDLIPHITENFLKIQILLSPNIQHLQISVDTSKEHPQLTKNLIDFIHSQRNLKSLLLTSNFWKTVDNFFQPFLYNALQKQSKSLTFLSLQDFTITSSLLLSMLKSLPNLITLELVDLILSNGEDLSSSFRFNNLKHLSYECTDSQIYFSNLNGLLFKQILLSSNNKLKSLKINNNYRHEIQQHRHLIPNLTHFHFIMKNSHTFGNLVILLKELPRLVHLKLDPIFDRDYLLKINHFEFENFSQALSDTLKILDLNFTIFDGHLTVLLNSTNLNFQCIKLYRYNHYMDTSLGIFIDYAKRKKCFRELVIPRDTIQQLSEDCIREAQVHFDITVSTDNEINIPFYDVPIKKSYWNSTKVIKQNSSNNGKSTEKFQRERVPQIQRIVPIRRLNNLSWSQVVSW